MATPINRSQPVKLTQSVVSAADLSAAADVLTYTCPTGRTAIIESASFFQTGGAAATVALQATISGVTITLQRQAVSFAVAQIIALAAGDIIKWRVTTGGAAGVGDLAICAFEFDVQ